MIFGTFFQPSDYAKICVSPRREHKVSGFQSSKIDDKSAQNNNQKLMRVQKALPLRGQSKEISISDATYLQFSTCTSVHANDVYIQKALPLRGLSNIEYEHPILNVFHCLHESALPCMSKKHYH